MKYNATELYRELINHGMDILGGNAISRGPRNALAHAYINTPIGVTVEGANILTRTLIIFGQGAIRSHPYVLSEVQAMESGDVRAFDTAFWAHVGMVIRNLFRSICLSMTRGRLARVPVSGVAARYYRRLAWASASFSILADMTLALLGGTLKRKEKITGRFADVFSWMYLASATLHRFVDEGQKDEDVPLLRYSMDLAFSRIQDAFDALFSSLRLPIVGWVLRGPVAIWSRANRFSAPPSDNDSHRLAVMLQTPGSQRDRLTDGIYVSTLEGRPTHRLDHAMEASLLAEPTAARLKKASRARTIPRGPLEAQLSAAVEADIISPKEAELVRTAESLRSDAIMVDSFTREEYFRTAFPGLSSES